MLKQQTGSELAGIVHAIERNRALYIIVELAAFMLGTFVCVQDGALGDALLLVVGDVNTVPRASLGFTASWASEIVTLVALWFGRGHGECETRCEVEK
jgi:hypothetical protein